QEEQRRPVPPAGRIERVDGLRKALALLARAPRVLPRLLERDRAIVQEADRDELLQQIREQHHGDRRREKIMLEHALRAPANRVAPVRRQRGRALPRRQTGVLVRDERREDGRSERTAGNPADREQMAAERAAAPVLELAEHER